MPQAPVADQLRLLDVQDLDVALQQARHRLAALPEREELERLTEQAGAISEQRIEAATEVSDIQREVTKAEDDVQAVRSRAERDNARLLAGGMTPKELTALQGEVEVLTKRQSDLEDIELEAMERLESAQGRADDLAEQEGKTAAAIEDARQRLGTSAGTIEAEIEDLTARRAAAIDGLDAGLVALYDKLCATHGGVGAARYERGQCLGCHMTLNPGDRSAIDAAAPEQIVRCEECGRILVRGAAS